jgi:hypothetical protein
MADSNGISAVQKNLDALFERRRIATVLLCKHYAAKAQQEFIRVQGTEQLKGQYWINRTSMAAKGVIPIVQASSEYVSWGLAHTMEYGKQLELANNRKHAALRPTVMRLAPAFMADVRTLLGGGGGGT